MNSEELVKRLLILERRVTESENDNKHRIQEISTLKKFIEYYQ